MKLETDVFGVWFQNPVLLAAGTCGFGFELQDVIDLEALGGFVTKSVTLEPRAGNPAPRVTEFGAGMLNSIGLANPGLEKTKRDKLPWIRDNIRRARVLVSVAGHSVEEYFTLIEGLDGEDGFVGFEINLSCPNDAKRDGAPFALDPAAVAEILAGCRARTERPVLAKLAPNDPDLAGTVRVATDAGADGLTLVNTVPGLLLHAESGAPELGAGQGGMSGPALRPVGLRAVSIASQATHIPIIGVGGISSPADAIAYGRAGASLVEMGTASFAAPRAAEKAIRGLSRWRGSDSWDALRESPE
jgi:dihydroorotate dehydrogenase (NAD+) catalytic subunit